MTRWRITVGAAILCAAGVALAGPHFLSATGSINGFGDLVASFKEAGLGSTPVTYDLSATSCKVVYECVNKGGNVAPGQPTVSGTNVSDLTTCTPHNGTISSPTGPCTVSLGCGATPNPKDVCPNGNWNLQPVSVAYCGVTLTDTTNSETGFSNDDFTAGAGTCP